MRLRSSHLRTSSTKLRLYREVPAFNCDARTRDHASTSLGHRLREGAVRAARARGAHVTELHEAHLAQGLDDGVRRVVLHDHLDQLHLLGAP